MGYCRDLHEWRGVLESRGYLNRIRRPINKDTEFHPLARLQFRGLREKERKGWWSREDEEDAERALRGDHYLTGKIRESQRIDLPKDPETKGDR